jgi:chorismate synthase
MSIPAVKGVAIGLGFESRGLEVHDAIDPEVEPGGAGRRPTWRIPPPTTGWGLKGDYDWAHPGAPGRHETHRHTDGPPETIHLLTGRGPGPRSADVTAVPAPGVIAEAVAALVLADAMLEKPGGSPG